MNIKNMYVIFLTLFVTPSIKTTVTLGVPLWDVISTTPAVPGERVWDLAADTKKNTILIASCVDAIATSTGFLQEQIDTLSSSTETCGILIKKDIQIIAGKQYNTIQAALDFIGIPQSLSDQKTRFVINICSGEYDEDLTIPSSRIITMLAYGPVTLGDGAGPFYQSTTPRNITWFTTDNTEFTNGPRPTLLISTLYPVITSTTHPVYAGGFDVSGDFIVTNTDGAGAATTHELHLYGVKVRQDFDSTTDFGILNTYMRRCFFDQVFNGPNANLNLVHELEIDSLITCATYGQIVDCEFSGGMTVSSSFISPVPPIGFFNTTFFGTYTSSSSNLLLDAASNFFFKANGASLAGTAIKVIQGDLVA